MNDVYKYPPVGKDSFKSGIGGAAACKVRPIVLANRDIEVKIPAYVIQQAEIDQAKERIEEDLDPVNLVSKHPGGVSDNLWYRINFAVDRAITFYKVKKQFEKDYIPGVGLAADAAKSSFEYFKVFGGIHSIPEFTTVT